MLAAPMAVRPGGDAGKLAAEVGRGRPALLHFWATWCDACSDEFPKLRDTLNALPARGVGVALVSIDSPKLRRTAQRYLKKFGVSGLPAFLLNAPNPDPVAAAIGDKSWDGTLPATFLFDAHGKLAKSFIGPVDPKALQAALLELGATSATPPTAPPKD